MAVYIVQCAPEWPGVARSCGGPGRSNASGHSLPTTLVYSWRDAIVFFLLATYIIARRDACFCSLILCYDWPIAVHSLPIVVRFRAQRAKTNNKNKQYQSDHRRQKPD